ncbi:MAG: glycosyltransferase [Butyrivibrio sp.]|nr:glycosyltransferase [Butyrivibrio sp.]
MEETVSIIVPVYRAADYIAETVEMVRRQTYKNWELILVDDCSPDNSADIIKEICNLEESGRIRLIRKEHNEGAAKARNAGIEAAAGRYIAFLDADDIWFPNKLERELAFMKEKQAAFVFSAYEFGDENAKGTGKIVKVPECLTYKKALTRTVIFTSTVIFDMSKFKKEQIYMPDVESEDTATWWKILRAGHTAYGLNEVLAIYRRPAKSLSSNKITALRRIWNLYRKEEGLTVAVSAACFCMWAVRAALRRI